MLDMGFIPDIERICKLVPFTRQTLFFTATMPPEIQRVTEQFLQAPARIEVARASSTASTITQLLVASGPRDFQKRDVLREQIRAQENFKNAIIFANRKVEVATLCRSLQRHGFNAAAIHGDLDQPARMKALDGFRNGEITLLVASDVAARGLDIPDVSHVFNYDLPTHAEDYVHRIGRTGRAGKLGTAISIVTPNDDKYLKAIEAMTKTKIEWLGPTISEYVPPPFEEREPRRERRRTTTSSRPKRDYAPKRDSSEPLETDAAMEPVRAEPRDEAPRAERARRPERAPRTPRAERPERAQRAERARPERDPRQSEARPVRQDRPRRDAEDREPTPQGFGDHVPGFLARSVRGK